MYFLLNISLSGIIIIISSYSPVSISSIWLFPAVKKISAFTSNLTYNLEPLYGIVLAFVIFEEGKTLKPQFYYGLLLILAALIIQMLRVYKQSKIKGNQS